MESSDRPTEAIEAIRAILREKGISGATTDELYQALVERDLRVPIRELRVLLRRLVTEGAIDSGTRASDGGRPARIFLHPEANPQPRLFSERQIRTREEVEIQDLLTPDERQRLTDEHGYLAEIGIDHLSRDVLVKTVREAVPSLAGEDPVALVLDFAGWTVQRLRALRRAALEALRRGARGEMQEPARQYEWAASFAYTYFQDLFRLHRGLGAADRIFEAADLERALDPSLPDEEAVFFDRARAEPVLRTRIVGDRVLEMEEKLSNFTTTGGASRVTTAATDASMIPVTVKTRPMGSYELPETLLIFTGAAAQVQTVAGGFARLVDHDLDPGFLATRDEVQAAEQGWMITEAIQEVIGEGHAKYAVSAAQEFRQYRRDADVLLNRIAWRRAPGLQPERADVLVRDGRLFPLVHRLRDYEAGGLYGRIVRNETQEFAEVCRRALDDYEYFTYGAFVKQPVAYFLAPLVFWYCRCRLNRLQRVPENAIFRPPLGDTLLSYIMLREFLKDRPPRERAFATTFRVLRRYSDLAAVEMPRLPVETGGYRPIDENSERDWEAYLHRRREERRQRWDERQAEAPPIPERDYRPLRFLCYRVGILMGFALPADGRFVSGLPLRLPRTEVLVDLSAPSKWNDQYRRLLAAFTEHDALVLDEDHPDGSAIQLIIPLACREAHRAAVFADDVYRREIERKLTEAVGAIERTLRRRGISL
jgi:hypothetical protein